MDASALGLLNLGVSESPTADQHVLAELAARHGYRITHVLTIDEETCAPRGADESRERRYSPPVIAVTG